MTDSVRDTYRSLNAYRPIEECAPVPHDLIKLILGYMFPMSCFLQHWNGKTDPNWVMSYLTGDSFRQLVKKKEKKPLPNLQFFVATIFEMSGHNPVFNEKVRDLKNNSGKYSFCVSLCGDRTTILSYNHAKRSLDFCEESDKHSKSFGIVGLENIFHMHCSRDRKQVAIVAERSLEAQSKIKKREVYLKAEGAPEMQLVETGPLKNSQTDVATYLFDDDLYLFQRENNQVSINAYDKETGKPKGSSIIENVGKTLFFDDITGILYYHDIAHKKLCGHYCKNGETRVLGSATFETVLWIDVQGEVIAIYHCTEQAYFVSLFHLGGLDKPLGVLSLDPKKHLSQATHNYRVKIFRDKLYLLLGREKIQEYSAP